MLPTVFYYFCLIDLIILINSIPIDVLLSNLSESLIIAEIIILFFSSKSIGVVNEWNFPSNTTLKLCENP